MARHRIAKEEAEMMNWQREMLEWEETQKRGQSAEMYVTKITYQSVGD